MFQIVLYENYKKIKVLHTYSRLYDANNRLKILNNKETFLPKKFIYRDKKLTEVNYKVFLFKKKEEGDKSILIRDNFGKIITESLESDEWVIIDEAGYQIEEQFNVTGANRKLNASEILNHVLLPKLSTKNTKQVFMLNNKIVIEGDYLNMVTCKNLDECIRLYNKIRKYCFDSKIKDVLFFGSIQKVDRKTWYKRIHAITGISYNRLYRNCSR
jgi:hypothetical protein